MRKEDDDGFVVETAPASQEGLRQFLGVEEENKPPESAEPVQESAPAEETPSEAAPSEETEQETAGDESGATEEPKEQEETQQPKRKPRRSVQRRIDALTRRNGETQRQLEEARRLLAERPMPEQPKPTEPPDSKAQPQSDDFETYEKYVEELTSWKVAQAIASERKSYANDQALRAQQAHLQAWETKLEDARELHEDFDEVAQNSDSPVSNTMRDAIMDSELGAEIAYWLCKNPEASRQLAALSPLAAAREIGKLEWHLSASQESSNKVNETPLAPSPTPKVSSAPAPISPVGGNTDRTDIPLDKMDMDQFTRERERQIAARGG